jgi:hypothetical protein
MNTIERRALYNLLRMNWLNDPTLAIEPWQVEDYRVLPLSHLFEQLRLFNIQLDRTAFVAYADQCDSPEDLTDYLVQDRSFKAAQEDRIYLLIFELWRRLMSEKPSLSVLCNELDYQIHLYDHGNEHIPSPALQDALTRFVEILDENVDEGIPAQQAFDLISTYCANDIETFLYDFISEQIEEGNESYAQELLDDFDSYLADNKWFKLLRMRLLNQTHDNLTHKFLLQIIEEHLNERDLDFNLELLSFMTEMGNPASFRLVIQHTLPLIRQEEEFHDLLAIAIDYFHRLDKEQQENQLHSLTHTRTQRALTDPVDPHDPDLHRLAHLFDL